MEGSHSVVSVERTARTARAASRTAAARASHTGVHTAAMAGPTDTATPCSADQVAVLRIINLEQPHLCKSGVVSCPQ